MKELLKNIWLLFFSPRKKRVAGQVPDQDCKTYLFLSLKRKEPKVQGYKYLAEYFIFTTEKIKLSRLLFGNIECGIKQKFSLFVVLIHILNAKYLRPGKYTRG